MASKAVPLTCFIKPKTLPFPKAEVAVLAKTTPENIVAIHHWRYSGWVEREGCLPITISYRLLSTWVPALQRVIDLCKGWRRLHKLWDSLQADFDKYPAVYPPEVREELKRRWWQRRTQLLQRTPQRLKAEKICTSYLNLIETAESQSYLDSLVPLIKIYDALWQRHTDLLQQLRTAWRLKRDYLRGSSAA